MRVIDWSSLDGRSVLVRSARDLHEPPVALRGTLQIEKGASLLEKARVSVVVDFPDMFTSPAHRRIFLLDEAEVGRLLALGGDVVPECIVETDLEAETRDKTVVAPRATQPE